LLLQGNLKEFSLPNIFQLVKMSAKSGALSWRGQGFLDTGDTVTGAGEGTWEEIGKHKWRTRLIVTTSDGGCHASDGHLDLKTRTLSGKMMEWS